MVRSSGAAFGSDVNTKNYSAVVAFHSAQMSKRVWRILIIDYLIGEFPAAKSISLRTAGAELRLRPQP
jgi:hypothetical protein